jgi:hypothetical protein
MPGSRAGLAAPLVEGAGGRLRTGRVVQRIEAGRQGVTVDAWDAATDTVERWQAVNCIVALPVFVAARVVVNAPDFLREAAARTRYSPWLVANLHIERALHDRPGAPPSWDNVLYGSAGLGYVDAMHQNLQRVPGATVLTYYTALGDAPDARRQLLERPWSHWRDAIVAELSVPHPDLREKLRRMDITRYGHAMAVPVPGMLAERAIFRNKTGDPSVKWSRAAIKNMSAFELNIAHINDHHSQLDAFAGTELTLDGVATQVELGGFARQTAVFKALAGTPNLLKLHAGDAITGSLYYTFFKGKADAQMMNTICFDAFVPGNHEFDDGDGVFKGFLDALADPANGGNCKTPTVSANIVPQAGTPLAPAGAAAYLQPYTIKKIDGVDVGIVGVTIAAKTANSSRPLATTQFQDERNHGGAEGHRRSQGQGRAPHRADVAPGLRQRQADRRATDRCGRGHRWRLAHPAGRLQGGRGCFCHWHLPHGGQEQVGRNRVHRPGLGIRQGLRSHEREVRRAGQRGQLRRQEPAGDWRQLQAQGQRWRVATPGRCRPHCAGCQAGIPCQREGRHTRRRCPRRFPPTPRRWPRRPSPSVRPAKPCA